VLLLPSFLGFLLFLAFLVFFVPLSWLGGVGGFEGGVVWVKVNGLNAAASATARKLFFIFGFSLAGRLPATIPSCASAPGITIACAGYETPRIRDADDEDFLASLGNRAVTPPEQHSLSRCVESDDRLEAWLSGTLPKNSHAQARYLCYASCLAAMANNPFTYGGSHL